VIPPGYSDPESGSDVVLVQLSSPVYWSDYIRPICLPASGTLFPAGLPCYVTGWGNMRNGGKARSLLHIFFAHVQISQFQECPFSVFIPESGVISSDKTEEDLRQEENGVGQGIKNSRQK